MGIAGFAIDFVGASASWAFVNGGVAGVIPPLVALFVMFLVYYFWKKYQEQGQETTDFNLQTAQL